DIGGHAEVLFRLARAAAGGGNRSFFAITKFSRSRNLYAAHTILFGRCSRLFLRRSGIVEAGPLPVLYSPTRFALRSSQRGRMDPIVAVLIVAAVLAGLALGWFLGSRPVADWRARHAECDAAAREHEAQFKQAVAELGQARIELATLRANAENFDKQIAQLNQAREDLIAQFKAAGGEVLSKAQEEFLKRAEEKFGHAEKTNKEAVAALLEPVNQRLKRYEDQVEALETKRQDAFGQLTGLIQSMREGQEAVRTAALQLGNSLRNAPKARGRWGEQQLKNVLEQCGLAEHTDFVTEQSVDTDEGRLRPDAIVRIPGNKLLVIDAKVSLN